MKFVIFVFKNKISVLGAPFAGQRSIREIREIRVRKNSLITSLTVSGSSCDKSWFY